MLIFGVKIGQFFLKNPEPNKFLKTNKFRLALSTPDQGLGFAIVYKGTGQQTQRAGEEGEGIRSGTKFEKRYSSSKEPRIVCVCGGKF